MSLTHSPQIVTDGLVFAYDMSNTKKSWKGRPVTNQFAIPTPGVNGDVGFQVNGTGTFRRIFSGTYGGYDIGPNDIVYRYDLGATGCHYHGNDVTINAGQTATWSFDYYVDPSVTGYPTTNYLANFEGVIGGSAGDPTPTQIGVWKRITFTGTAGSIGTCRMLLYPGACGDRLATGGFVLFKNPQVEFDAPGNNPSPFVAGTRSNTQAIVDLVGQNTVTANGLTYNSDGTISFLNNSGFSIPTINFADAQTIEIWLKPLEADGNRRNPYNQAYAGYGTWTHEPDGSINYYYGDGGGDNSPYIGHTSGFTVSQNEIACVCTTRDLTTSWWYKNGVQYNSYSHSFGSLTATSGNITIGNGYAGAYYGNIYAVKLYNRALTAAEVKQNFQALRGRYGI